MSVECTSICEHSATHVTSVLLVSTVNTSVFPEIAKPCETLVWSVSSVTLSVMLEVTNLAKCFVTFVTNVRFFTHVNVSVRGKMMTASKHFVTHITYALSAVKQCS